MENLSAYRYCIAMKKGRKIFNIIAGCIMILISSIFIILTVIFYVLEQEFGFYTFLGILLIPLIFFIFGILGIVAATKRVEIYKGKVVYHIGFSAFLISFKKFITITLTNSNLIFLYYINYI